MEGRGEDKEGFVVWFTGLSGAGKSTLAEALAPVLAREGDRVQILDGDEVRKYLSAGLGFSKADRDANILRIGFVAELLARHGVAVLVAAISPYAEARLAVRSRIPRFVEVHADCDLEQLVERDPKGLYARALQGEIKNFTGIDDPYEPPESPEVRVDSGRETVQESLSKILAALAEAGLVAPELGEIQTTPAIVERSLQAGPEPSGAAAPSSTARPHYELSHLQTLEAESIHIFREVFAEFERPALLFSGGKDSIVMLHIASKAFRPMRIPFPVVHIDTGQNFPETIEFRDRRVADLGVRLIVGSVQEAIDAGRVIEEKGPRATRNRLQTQVLLDTIREHRFDALFGGGRRDEEKARAKERIFSVRDEFGQWDPRAQRPELWNLYNCRIKEGEHMRVFPLSNWTELDVWQYIANEGIEIPSLYLAHRRRVFLRDGMLMPQSEFVPLMDGEKVFEASVRFRTIGDMACTAGVESDATSLDEVIAEIAATRVTERGETRADDRFSETAMEDRKRQGYF